MVDFNVCCLGALHVGRTTLVTCFIDDILSYHDPHYRNDLCYRKNITVDENYYVLDIMDAQPENDPLTELNILIANGILFLFSLTDCDSLAYAEQLIEHAIRIREFSDIPMFLIATKSDLKEYHKVSIEEGQTLANKYDIPFFVTSAKDYLNVKEIFTELTRRMVVYQQNHTKNSRKGKCVVM